MDICRTWKSQGESQKQYFNFNLQSACVTQNLPLPCGSLQSAVTLRITELLLCCIEPAVTLYYTINLLVPCITLNLPLSHVTLNLLVPCVTVNTKSAVTLLCLNLPLPCVTLKSAIGCDHVDTWWLEWKLPWKNQLAMVYPTCSQSNSSFKHYWCWNETHAELIKFHVRWQAVP